MTSSPGHRCGGGGMAAYRARVCSGKARVHRRALRGSVLRTGRSARPFLFCFSFQEHFHDLFAWSGRCIGAL